jgi:hypothetical protein
LQSAVQLASSALAPPSSHSSPSSTLPSPQTAEGGPVVLSVVEVDESSVVELVWRGPWRRSA